MNKLALTLIDESIIMFIIDFEVCDLKVLFARQQFLP